jgi:hypothetical protein
MRIDNALSYMMDRRAGSSKSTGPVSYDVADCHECVFRILWKVETLLLTRTGIQGVYKGYAIAITQLLSHSRALIVFGYTEYKGKQKEIFDAAINGMRSRSWDIRGQWFICFE